MRRGMRGAEQAGIEGDAGTACDLRRQPEEFFAGQYRLVELRPGNVLLPDSRRTPRLVAKIGYDGGIVNGELVGAGQIQL